MPRYEYFCPKCDIDFEVDLPVDHQKPACPSCKDTQVIKCMTSANFTIKGFNAKNHYGVKK